MATPQRAVGSRADRRDPLDPAVGVARDLGPRGITANVVEAGLMEGGIEAPDPETLKVLLSSLSLQRMGHPREMAAAIAFLASPAASYVTGAVLDAHGGYNA
jgi:NAD(P)-dependent dehydrogenase (short-subunit alcohol dehydrogenase family)